MIELKKDFVKWKRHFSQLYKDDDIVIYEVSVPDADGDGLTTYYEVFRYRVRKPDKFHDDEYECYPSDESFGSWAWCCSNKRELKRVIMEHWGDDKEIPQI